MNGGYQYGGRGATPNTGSGPNVSSGRPDIKQILGYNDSAGVYEMDHLATFTLPPNQAKFAPTDAVRKLYDLDASISNSNSSGGPGGGAGGGVWTMKVYLCVEAQFILVIDAANYEEMERFPINMVTEPACVTPRSGSQKFNNIVLFTVLGDPSKGSPTETHLFQCLGGPGQQVVDDIISSVAGKPAPFNFRADPVASQPRLAPTPAVTPQRHSQDMYKDFGLSPEQNAQVALKYKPDPAPRQKFRQSMRYPEGAGPRGAATPSRAEAEPSRNVVDQAETMERCFSILEFDEQALGKGPADKMLKRSKMNKHKNSPSDPLKAFKIINLLDHCFSDIEGFVAKLQQAAVAYNELDRRKTVRGNKFNGKQIGDGLLGMRAKPPSGKEFVDILQKFKLSFILLAKLKGHIRDPNAPELVHFLFNPLGLVVESSRAGTTGEASDLVSRVVTPLFTPDARDLLDNCLTSKETELWKSLGPAWTVSRDRWEGDVHPYLPQFYDGWLPPNFWLEEIGVKSVGAVPSSAHQGTPTIPQSLQNKFMEPTDRYSPQPVYQGESYGTGPMSQSSSASNHSADLTNGNQIYLGSPGSVPLPTQKQQQPAAVVVEKAEEKPKKKGWGLFGGGSGKSKNPPAEAAPAPVQAPIPVIAPVQVAAPVKTKDEKPKVPEKVKKPAPPPPAKSASTGIYGNNLIGVNVLPMGSPNGPMGGPNGPVGGPYGPMGGPLGGSNGPAGGPMGGVSQSTTDDLAQNLKNSGAKMYRVIQNRRGDNAKELSIKEGEILEVLDDSRNWWNCRNGTNMSGFVPRTFLEKV